MGRTARLESETGYYHVMMRGINRAFIFDNDEEKQCFMKLVKEQQDDEKLQQVAWCLMDNHVHMVLKADLSEMSKAIKIISVKYASYYNRRYKRTGPVFGDRFKSEVVENDIYLLEIIRYVHNNPVKAKLVEETGDYKWSSYTEYRKEANCIKDEQKSFIMDYFENDQKKLNEFHNIDDGKEYLEIKEDVEKDRYEKAQSIITVYCKNNDIIDSKQIITDEKRLKELVKELLETKLSVRKISKLLEVSVSRIHRIGIQSE